MWFGQWTSRGLTRPSFSNAKGTVCIELHYEVIIAIVLGTKREAGIQLCGDTYTVFLALKQPTCHCSTA